jgi:hypothetical protein
MDLNKIYQKPGVNDPLQEKSIAFTAAASGQTSQNFTAPTNRGDILGVQVFVGDTTMADLISGNITISANGINVYELVTLAKYATIYQNDNNEFPFYAASGSVVSIIVNTGTGVAIPLVVNFLFRPVRNK